MFIKDKKSSVLIVDDDKVTARLFKEFIADLDIDIAIANSGKEALEIAQERSFSVLLLDVQMPEMNGYELLEKLRKAKAFERTPAIFISAYFGDQENILAGIESGAIDFISKPVNAQILNAKIKQFVKLDEYKREREYLIRKYEESNIRAKENENRYRQISYTANDSIIVLNEKFKILFWNRASKNIFGYSKFEIRDENIFDFIISPGYKQILQSKFNDILNSKRDILHKTEEVVAINKLGYEFLTEMSFSSFKTMSGGFNIVLIARDITFRKKLEKNLLKAKELRESNKTMKEFIDNVSHELRTPMNAILGISGMLSKYNKENLTNKQLEGLNIIKNNGEKLLELINDILDLSKLDSGKINLNEEEFSLDKLLSNIRSVVINLIDSKNIKFIIKKSPGVPDIIYSDQKKLTQILLNLLGNSVKFTTSGKIVLSLHLKAQRLHFEVFDSGCGIPENSINTIFNRFNQVDNSNSKLHQGTGLGLHIVKKMVTLFKGRIKIESTVNKSTTVMFSILLSRLVSPSTPTAAKNEDTAPKQFDSTLKKQFLSEIERPLALIIEDNQDTALIYKNCMEHINYTVIVANDGIEGKRKVEVYRPSLVIINLEIKKFSSFSILRKIDEVSEFKSIKVITISATQHQPSSIKLYSSYKFLIEPVSEKDLADSARNLNPKVYLESTEVIVFNDQKFKHNIKLIDATKPYEFSYKSIEKTYYLYKRRNSQLTILNGISQNSVNHQLVGRLQKEVQNQSSSRKILVITDESDKKIKQLNISDNIRVINSGTFKNPVKLSKVQEILNSNTP